MISLHKIMEVWKKEGLTKVNGISKDTMKLLGEYNLPDKMSQAVCFDLGDVSSLKTLFGLSVIGNFIKLPYPVCWFEFEITTTGINRFGIFCMETEINNEIVYFCFKKWPGEHWSFLGKSSLMFSNIPEQNSIKWLIKKTENFDKMYGCSYVMAVHLFLSALGCNNIKKIENLPNKKLQKKRIKNGKQPLFSYWTLHLKVPNESKDMNNNCGGSHSSPRIHLRRGHIRQYEPGKWCWVQHCIVGNKEFGMIHKDYKIKKSVD